MATHTVTICESGAFGLSSLTLSDGGSTAEQLVGMFRSAMAAAGFPEAVIDRVRFEVETVTDAAYAAGLSD